MDATRRMASICARSRQNNNMARLSRSLSVPLAARAVVASIGNRRESDGCDCLEGKMGVEVVGSVRVACLMDLAVVVAFGQKLGGWRIM